MKIILATPIYPPEIGGPATYTVEIAKRLRGEHDILVVAYSDKGEEVEGTRLVRVIKDRSLPLRLISFFFTLIRAAKGADVIYAQNAMAAGLPAMLVGKLRNIPVVIKFVGDEAWERATQSRQTTKRLEEFLAHPDGGVKIRLMKWVQGVVLRNVAIVTTPSAYLRDALVREYGVHPERGVVNYNAVEDIPVDASIVRTPYQIITTARLTAWKGVDGIIRAVSILAAKFPQVKLVVAGDGPEKEPLMRLVQEKKLEKHTDFLGRVEHDIALRRQQESVLQVLNSTYEGLPHIVLESFATKTPIVATNIPGTNETVYHEKTGLLVETGDDVGLAQAITRVFEDVSLREKIVEGGTKLLQEKFSWQSHISNLLAIFRGL